MIFLANVYVCHLANMCRRSLIYAPFLMKWFTPPSWWMQTQITALFWNVKKNSYLWLNPPVERFGTLKWFECELAPWLPWPFVSTVGSGNPDLRVQKFRSLIDWVKRKQMKCKTEPKIQDDVCEEEGDEPEVKGGLCELLHVQVEGGQLRGELGNHLS